MKHVFILNPAAGDGGKYRPYLEKIAAACGGAGVDYLIHSSTAAGEATLFTRDFITSHPGEPLRFYAVGGDGTLCEVVTGVADAPLCEVGLVPIGTGNDFVRNFTHSEYFLDIGRQLGGEALRLDAVRFCDRLCINMFNVGFDCAVVGKVAEIKRHPLMPSGLAYNAGVVITLVRKPTVHVRIVLGDGEVFDRELLLFTAANGCWYGGGYRAAPRADLRDGLLDVALVKDVSRAKFVSMVGSYKKGLHLDRADIDELFILRRTDALTVEFSEPVPVCADGEIELRQRVELKVLPRVVSFSLPAGSEYPALQTEKTIQQKR